MRCCLNYLRTVLLFVVMTTVMSGCAFFSLKNWFDAAGDVKYRDIDKGAPNVHVAAVWRGQNTDKENTFECYHVYATKTDNQGKFHIEGWREYFGYGHLAEKKMSIIVYKPGFWDKDLLRDAPTEKEHSYYIESADDKNGQTNGSERLKFLQKLVGLTSCDVKNPNRSQLKPMFDDILAEAEPLAKSPIDKKILASIKTWTEFVSPDQPKPADKKKDDHKKATTTANNDDKKDAKKVKLKIVKPAAN